MYTAYDSHRNAPKYHIDSQAPKNTSHFAMRVNLFSSLVHAEQYNIPLQYFQHFCAQIHTQHCSSAGSHSALNKYQNVQIVVQHHTVLAGNPAKMKDVTFDQHKAQKLFSPPLLYNNTDWLWEKHQTLFSAHKLNLKARALISKRKKVKASHTHYRALGPELIPVYRQSACRWL